MYQDFQDKEVNFYYVYKSLAHPEINGFVQPHSLQERLSHIKKFREVTGSQIPWLCDSMQNELSQSFGKVPNGEFVIDPEGTIIRQRFWSNPITLREDLNRLLGQVKTETKPEDALPAFEIPARNIANGVVPRLDLPGNLRPVLCKIQASEFPAFAKLRVEATADLLRNRRSGKIYLGVYLDPLYRVHWNNQAGKVSINITASDDLRISDTQMESPQVESSADLDPRMFLIDVIQNGNRIPAFKVEVTYTVCDDANTFCQTVSQSYDVELRGDRNLGSRPGVFMPEMFARVAELDLDNNGRIEKGEFPKDRSTLYLSHMDTNLDQVIDAEEIERFMAMFNDGRGFESTENDGAKRKRR